MRLTARRIVAIAALTLTTFAATHAGDMSRQAGGMIDFGMVKQSTHATIQAGGMIDFGKVHSNTTFNS